MKFEQEIVVPEFIPFTIKIETKEEAELLSAFYGALPVGVTSAFKLPNFDEATKLYDFLLEKYGISGNNRPRINVALRGE